MSAAMNGMAVHGGYIPFGGTFLTFSDYSRNALRMAALMELRVHLRLHPRFDRPRRGRADPPGGGAHSKPAAHSQHAGLAALRRGGNRRRLAGRHRAGQRPELPRADPPGAAGPAPPAGADRGHPARRLRAAGCCPRGPDPDRHRFGSGSRGRRRGCADGTGSRRARRFDAVPDAVRRPRTPPGGSPCCRLPSPAALPSRPV